MAAPTTYLPPRLIALEEHALFPSLQPISAFYNATMSADPSPPSKLQDIGDGRIADMDTGHITTQILSTIPGIASTDPQGCISANDALAAAIAKHPTRLGGFAALPMAHPDLAASELHRAVKDLGLVGAMIDNHLPNRSYYDSTTYDPVFAMAEKLDVPIYIHPAPPTDSQIQFYQGNYPPQTALKLAASAWGWHADVGQHLIRLYVSGLFLRHPNLKIVIGHDGETLPMMIDRVDDSKLRTDQTFREVWERNLWVTTSGFFHLRTLEMLMKVTKIERVMFSVDYPLVDIAKGWRFVEEVAGSGILSER
ncbi:hypothetical protein M409DRAFT_29290 [Zasmidium cellare ATCC 36951]|uniref:Amidohydrolase-related domain-containing protein n=1 Tax=Zasmidium cellare ATCC 36951 TaxID=1080233 RepID=A0A6A6BZR4_ZASCE|nr:uncharacterized protein M409DRAFT_29290 [Zasmidium cellare ATCC 36951]KAF2160205.1 hypothetical protein M409DRAFT_29290 [Zasmidium cellare ATCC 36951]